MLVDAKVKVTGPSPTRVRSTFVDTSRGWQIEIEPVDAEGQDWEIRSLTLRAMSPGNPITADAMREIADNLPGFMAFTAQNVGGLADEMSASDAVAAAGAAGDELARVAETYKRAVAETRPPVVAVEQELGLKKATANRRIRKARDLGLLPPTGRESK